MKEYIAKEDLIEAFSDFKRRFWENSGVVKRVNDIPTVTKADICREFADKVKNRINASKRITFGIIDVDVAKGLVDDVLAEMERE